MTKDKFTSEVVDTLGAIYERGFEAGKKETATWIPVSVIEDIKADIKSEYVSLRHRTDEDIELGECIGLKIALGIIDRHTIAKMIEPQESEE